MSLLDICVIIILLIFGFNLKNFFHGFSKVDKRHINYLYLYHLIITLVFYFFINIYGGDAQHYWEAPKIIPLNELVDMVSRHYATGIIYFINYIPSKVLSLSFFTGNLIYSTLGFIGFVYLIKLLKIIIPSSNERRILKLNSFSLLPWILFLPNFHFWTSGVGKDSLLFLAIALFFYSLANFKQKWHLMFISILISFALRPHILLFLASSTFGGLIFHNRIKLTYKVIFGLGIVVSSLLLFSSVLRFVQLEISETSAISEFITARSGNLNRPDVDSGIDISSYSYPFKVFTFLFRPLFLDVRGILYLISSFENLILLFFFVKVLMNRPIRSFINSPLFIKSSILFFILGTMTFSLLLGNLGIMLRQKNMLMPWLILFGLWVFYSRQQSNSLSKQIASRKE